MVFKHRTNLHFALSASSTYLGSQSAAQAARSQRLRRHTVICESLFNNLFLPAYQRCLFRTLGTGWAPNYIRCGYTKYLKDMWMSCLVPYAQRAKASPEIRLCFALCVCAVIVQCISSERDKQSGGLLSTSLGSDVYTYGTVPSTSLQSRPDNADMSPIHPLVWWARAGVGSKFGECSMIHEYYSRRVEKITSSIKEIMSCILWGTSRQRIKCLRAKYARCLYAFHDGYITTSCTSYTQ